MLTNLTYSPSTYPGDIYTLVQHARIDNNADATLLQMYADTATELVEAYLSRFLITRDVTWTIARDSNHPHQFANQTFLLPWYWGEWLRHPIVKLPRPATAITSVAMGIWGAADVPLIEGTDFATDFSLNCGRMKWLDTTYQNTCHDHLTVVFTTGYGSTLGAIPTSIQHALMLLVTSVYERRGDESPAIWSPAVEALLAPHRFNYFG